MQLTRQLDELTPELADEARAAVESLDQDGSFELRNHADWKAVVLQTVSRIYVGMPSHDLVTWAVQDAFDSGKAEKQSPDFLAARLSMMNFVSIDSTSITIENVFYDILCNLNDRSPRMTTGGNLLDDLRSEIQAAYNKHHDHRSQWKNIINDLPLLEACLKESFRLNNFISRTNIRKVMAPEGIDVPDIGRIPQGTVLGVSLWGAHHDEEAYPDAGKWRMSRWLDGGEREKISVFGKGSAKSLDQYLPFGYRRHSCPGRFFALRVVKLIIVHLLLDYDVEMSTKERPWNPWLGVSRGPPMGSSIRFTRRP
ncbi:hypothetical protein AMS68_003816 [Peltaster fructicola]|uniref:Cytochrome P450 n=1 Tax=Peltaster fructicola TaxID=286661 RepID=A0A6H0XUJ8_9PEZI|nr:hypothetical protein AMS68_003816 [Peltaster fructicola]